MPNGWGGVASGAAVIFFAYIGFDAVSTVAEEAKKPQRDLPIGIIGSLVVCTIFYIVVAGVFTGVIPYADLVKKLSSEQAEPLTLALQYSQVTGLAIFIVALGSVVAHMAVLFVFQLGQPRIFFSMARDGLLPSAFAKVHPNFRTPWVSTILTGVAVGTAAMFTTLDEMVDLTNVGTLFAFIVVCIGLIVLRVRESDRKRPFRVPCGLLLPVLGAIGCLGLIYYLPPTSWLRFAAWLSIGFLIYVGYGSVRSRLTGRSVTKDHAIHNIQTAYAGAWLGVFGTILIFIAHIADIIRLGPAAHSPWLFDNSWWLSIPLFFNVSMLCPTIICRASRAKKTTLSIEESTRANQAIFIACVLMSTCAFYLISVFIY